MNVPEPTLRDAIRKIHQSGGYMTFMYQHRPAFEAAKSGTEIVRLFLGHLVKQAVNRHAGYLIREHCEPILAEARARHCVYFKSSSDLDSIRLIFNNGKDIQYSRSIGEKRIVQWGEWQKYGQYPDILEGYSFVESFFLSQRDIGPMIYGIPRRLQKKTF